MSGECKYVKIEICFVVRFQLKFEIALWKLEMCVERAMLLWAAAAAACCWWKSISKCIVASRSRSATASNVVSATKLFIIQSFGGWSCLNLVEYWMLKFMPASKLWYAGYNSGLNQIFMHFHEFNFSLFRDGFSLALQKWEFLCLIYEYKYWILAFYQY